MGNVGVLRRLVQVGFFMLEMRFDVEHDLVDGPREGERRLGCVAPVHDATVVPSDVHARVAREPHRYGVVHPAATDILVVDVERHLTASGRLYQLVLRTLVLASERLDREELRYAALTAQLGLAVSDQSILGSRAEALMKLGAMAMTWATELRAHETARDQVEAEYFEGTPTLYPATHRRWTEQREMSDGLVDLIARLAELDGLDPLPASDPDALAARVDQLVADHVEPARVKALDEMGESRRAASIALRWLTPRLG